MNVKLKHFTIFVIVFFLAFSAGFVFANGNDDQSNSAVSENEMNEYTNPEEQSLKETAPYAVEDTVRVIVELKEKPGLTQMDEKQLSYSEADEATKKQLQNKLINRQQYTLDEMEKQQISFQLQHQFSTVFYGFSGDIKYGDIDKLENIPKVKAVHIANTYDVSDEIIPMHYSPDLIQHIKQWEDEGSSGQGMIVNAIGTKQPIENDIQNEKVLRHATIQTTTLFESDSTIYADEVVAAMDGAVMKGTDLIQLNIGIPMRNYVFADDPEQQATSLAVEHGIGVAVSSIHDDALEPYKKWRVGIFIYEGVEELDFAGPFEVFSVASYQTTMFDAPQEDKPFEVVTISKDGNGITTHNGLAITPNYSMENTPDLDILIVPGGVIEPIFYDEDISKWIGEQSKKVDILSSVCNGAFLIAKHGVLNDRTATTHWQVISVFRAYFPDVEVLENVKFVDEGDVVTSAGISAGLDMSFHLLQRLTGKEVAAQAATFMEYDIELE